MRDTELYRHLLGLESPWTVGRVELDQKGQRVDVWAEHAEGRRWPCPKCGTELSVYDHAPERSWRHLDSCQYMTYLRARPPRVKCPKDGVVQVNLPWAEPKARFTAMFERLAIDVLRETDVLGATRILRITWDEAHHLMTRAVERGRAAKGELGLRRMGVDEKAVAKGHQYFTLVTNLDTGTVEYVGEERKTDSLNAFFVKLTPEQRESIEAVAMDMWEPYQTSVHTHVPKASEKIVFDRFHIMQHMGRAVDAVRKQEHRQLRAAGDDTLVGSKYLWLYSYENLPDKQQERFAALRSLDLKTGRAWAIKENLRQLWSSSSRVEAEEHWKRWFFWATHSRLAPVVKAARTIYRHIDNILTYFEHRITNAVSEGLNSKIQTIKKQAYGFRNKENFKTAIYFHCGGLDLYPASLAASSTH